MKSISFKVAAFIAIALPGVAIAASPIQLSSDIYVEKLQKQDGGKSSVVLEAPKTILPGDQLVFVVRYKNVGSQVANGFTVTNPIPRSIAFSGTSDGTEIVSIDGGKNWGRLGQLRVAKDDGTSRPALMTDVTHIKWKLNQNLAAGSAGKLIFRGVVK
jgi:uncharacterized repeat protein (TIGR01451 family)